MFELLHPLDAAYLHAAHDRDFAAADRFRLHPYGIQARHLASAATPIEPCRANLAGRIACALRPARMAAPQPCC